MKRTCTATLVFSIGLLLGRALPAQQATAPRLETIRVTAASACGRDANAGDIGTVWTAARAALAEARRAAAASPPTVQALHWVRELDAVGREVLATEDTIVARSAQLFQTLTSAVLSRDGYRVRGEGGDLLFAPDAGTLLSDEFARDHCFRLVADPRVPEAIGLRFTPEPTREQVDIAGVFWMDRESGHLMRVEYEYRNVEPLLEEAQAGGALSFGPLAEGVRGITTWEVRTPLIATVQRRTARTVETEQRLGGVRIEGAGIAEHRAASVAAPQATGRIEGRIVDPSRAGGGLAGARATALGTGRAVLADSTGHFVLERVPAGPVTLRVDHERLRLFGVDNRRALTLPADSALYVEFAVPSGTDAYATLCPRSGGSEGRAALIGRVLDGTLDVGVPQAAVQASWRGRIIPTFLRSGAVRGETDEFGHFILCDLNTSARVSLIVLARGFRQLQLSVLLRSGAVVERELRLMPCQPSDRATVCPER